jgi:exo-beta-1,3-glucanase (GH17 family)
MRLPLLALFLISTLFTACSDPNQPGSTPSDGSTDADFAQQAPSALIAGVHRAVAYSGYRSGQHPDRGDGAKNPSRDEVLEDLQILSNGGLFPLIRLYDSQENSRVVLEVISENNLPIRVMLGAWLKAELSNHEGCAWLTEPIPESELAANREANAAEVKEAIRLAQAFPEIVVAVNIGNEALAEWNDHLVPIDQMVRYLREANDALEQPVTTAENYVFWVQHAEALSAVADFAGVHSYPVWENKPIEEGLAYTIENLAAVQRALPDLPLAIVEAGWASVASEFPDQANEANQERYFNELMAWSEAMNLTTFWFEAFDEDWKGNPDNPMGAEKHWGVYTVVRQPKAVLSQRTERP